MHAKIKNALQNLKVLQGVYTVWIGRRKLLVIYYSNYQSAT